MKILEYSKWMMFVFVISLGLTLGASVKINFAQDPTNDCGVCNHTNPDIPGGFCDFTFYGDCAGNNGGPCGSVACGGHDDPPNK